MITAGELNCRIEIQQRSGTRDNFGQVIDDWSTLFTVWANIRHLSGMETVRSGMEVSSVKASIRIRYLNGIAASMRVKHGSDIYSIEAAMPDRVGREYVDLVCSIGANDG